MGRHRRSDISDETVVRLYRSGLTIREVARSLGCDSRLVYNRLVERKEPRRSHWSRKTVSFEEVERRYRAGEKIAGMAADLGITPSAIYARLKRHGIPVRKSKEKQSC